MRAITISKAQGGHREIQVEHKYPKPTPGKGEVLIKVILAGICGTDLEILEGYKSLQDKQILGHEFVGFVCALGSECQTRNSRNLSLGDRVVAEINCVPFGCISSRNAVERAQDPARTALGIFGRDGAFSEYVTVPIENLHKVPDGTSDVDAVFVEPVASACQILEQTEIPGSHKVGVLGGGKLGWLVAQVLLACGKDVTVLTRNSQGRTGLEDGQLSSMELAKYFNAKLVLLQEPETLVQLANTFDDIVDCTGNPKGLETAIHLVRPRGTVILKSTTAPSNDFGGANLTPVVVKEIRILGSRCGPFPTALRLLQRGSICPSKLVRTIMSPEDAEAAFQKAQERGSLKVLLRFEDRPRSE